jgi:hypothetical protein
MKEPGRLHLRLLLIPAALFLALVITPPAAAAPAQGDRVIAPAAALAPTCTPKPYAPTKPASSGRVYFSGALSCNYTTYVITLSVLKDRNGTYLGKVERKRYDCSYTPIPAPTNIVIPPGTSRIALSCMRSSPMPSAPYRTNTRQENARSLPSE